jgi:molybdopterin-guanine dinucleotide biosynthesis protein A
VVVDGQDRPPGTDSGADPDNEGWTLDPATLREVITDHGLLERGLISADPVRRLRFLRLLGRLEEARAEVSALLGQATNALRDQTAARPDSWEVLLAAADVYADGGDQDAAERLRETAWRRALSRERQAQTLHHLGIRHIQANELDRAASELALAAVMRRGFADTDVVARTEDLLDFVRSGAAFDAIVLAGGSGQRLGGRDKPAEKLLGWPLIDHVLLAASAAQRQIVVGPPRRSLSQPIFCREEPPGTGPVAAVAAASPLVISPFVALLAADQPFIGSALGPLRAALADGRAEAAVLVDPSGQLNYLAAMWRSDSLTRALDELGPDLAGARARGLYERVELVHVPDFDGWGQDCDTWEEIAAAEQRLKRRSPARLSAAPLAWPRLELYSPS